MVSLDWLSFSVRLVLSAEERFTNEFVFNCPPNCTFVELGGTNIYKRRAYILDEVGDKVVTLLWCPYSKVIANDLVFVEVANKWLYYDLDWIKDWLWNVHHYTFASMSRYDLATDFSPSNSQYEIIRGLSDMSLYVQGKKEQVMFSDLSMADGVVMRLPRQISWGSHASNIKWKLYNKTLELTEFAKDGTRYFNKPYIVDRWRENGLDIDNVWRLECSITSAAKFSHEDSVLDLEKGLSEDYQGRLFGDLYGSRFVIRRNQGHKDRSNDERVWLLPLKSVVNRVSRRPPHTETHYVELAATLRVMLQQLQSPSVRLRDDLFHSVHSTIVTLLEMPSLAKYFHNQYQCDFETWVESLPPL